MLPPSRTHEWLGYPPDARLLIINTDDFGMCHAINMAVIQTIVAGIASSCTLMPPCPWALHGLHLLRDNPTISAGVHLTVISEPMAYRWRPLASSEKVPSLIDDAGYFYSEGRIPQLLARAELHELELEFRAQIEMVFAAGIQPTHVDSHCDIVSRRADIFDMTLGLAKEYGLSMRVLPPFSAMLHDHGLPANDYALLDSYDIETAAKPGFYTKALRELPPGLTEWAMHPGWATGELKAISDSWPVRQADFEFLMSSEAHEIIRQEGIILLNYQPLQKLWRDAMSVGP